MTDRRHPKHRAFLRLLDCVACGAAPSECAHVRMSHFDGVTVPETERGGTGLKPADKWCVPLCRSHHKKQHDAGERRFWEATWINPLALAAALWRNTGNLTAARGIIYRARNGAGL